MAGEIEPEHFNEWDKIRNERLADLQRHKDLLQDKKREAEMLLCFEKLEIPKDDADIEPQQNFRDDIIKNKNLGSSSITIQELEDYITKYVESQEIKDPIQRDSY